jgi:hypothetical protein
MVIHAVGNAKFMLITIQGYNLIESNEAKIKREARKSVKMYAEKNLCL